MKFWRMLLNIYSRSSVFVSKIEICDKSRYTSWGLFNSTPLFGVKRPIISEPAKSKVTFLSKPVVSIIVGLRDNFIVNLFFKKKEQDTSIKDQQSEEELEGEIDLYKTSNPDYEREKEMLQSILQLNDTTVEEVFTHRKNIYSIDSSLETPDLINKINKSHFTRIPFWKENPENIIGLLNVRSLNIDLGTSDSSKKLIFEKINKPWFVPETTNLLDQLVEFKKRKEHLAFVVDEYGELLGLITLEDIIEETYKKLKNLL